MTERDRMLRELKECFTMKKENPYDVVVKGYKKALSLHDRGLTIDNLKELYYIYKEGGLYSTCIGFKLAISRLMYDKGR